MDFVGSASATVGIEFELQLLDAETLDLMNGIIPLLQLFPDRADVKPEMIQSCVEVSSSVSEDTVQAGNCMHSTLSDLLQRGLAVHVAVDGVASRKPNDRDVALARMERAGAVLTTSEAAAFELLEDAKHPKFKEVQALYK